MLNKQPTTNLFLASRYETNNDLAPPCCSSRIVTPVRQAPGIITPSGDSRHGLAELLPLRDVRDAHFHRQQERSAPLPGNEASSEPARGQSKMVQRPYVSCLFSQSVSRIFVSNFMFSPYYVYHLLGHRYAIVQLRMLCLWIGFWVRKFCNFKRQSHRFERKEESSINCHKDIFHSIHSRFYQ